MIDSIAAALAAISVAELFAVALAVAYLVLAIRQNIYCWLAALVSSFLYMGLFFRAQLYMESILQIFYAVMAIYGWHQWRYGGLQHRGVRISVWTLGRHGLAITGIVATALFLGWGMSHTDAAFPYVDSFTTVAAVVTTYMVARKILENWGYWFVIDGISVYLYISRELYLTALLFVFYLVLIVIGFRAWWRDYQVGEPGV